jgi:AcrR family transcriptional regulator
MSLRERQQEEKAQRRRTILDAAETVLARDGRASMTMGAIADDARLSRSLLYVYFEDMDDIVLGVTLRAFQDLTQRFQAAVDAHEQGIDKIRAIGEAYIRFAHDAPVYFDLLAQFEAQEATPEAATDREQACLAALEHVLQIMVDAIQTGIDDGSMRPDLDPMRTAMILWGHTHGLIQLASHKGAGIEARHNLSPGALLEAGLDFEGVALTGFCETQATTPPMEPPSDSSSEA